MSATILPMLTVKRLREIISTLPDDAALIAYEGEGIGLRVIHGKSSGWIETGHEDNIPANESLHDIGDFEPASL